MNLKAQIKFGETFGVMIIVFILLIVGVVWYNNINTKSIIEIQTQDKYDRAFEKFDYIKNLDLIHVSQRGIIDEEIDYNSLKVLEKYSKTKDGDEYLSNHLGKCTITINIYNYSTIYEGNLSNPSETIILYNSTYPQTTTIKENIILTTLLPITNQQENRNDIGVLKVIVPIATE